MPKIGVILSGCGVYDGSEIHEAVITMLCLSQRGADYQCLAPKIEFDVVDHMTQKKTGEERCVFTESARIARGNLVDLAEVTVTDYDGFVLPGGFGAAKNLCSFAIEGADCSAHPEIQRVLSEAQEAGKPLGFACIAPAIAARVFGETLHPRLTIGHSEKTAAGLEAMGAKHVACDVDGIVVDEENHIVTTPAYMEAKKVSDLYSGIDQMVEKVLQWAEAEVTA